MRLSRALGLWHSLGHCKLQPPSMLFPPFSLPTLAVLTREPPALARCEPAFPLTPPKALLLPGLVVLKPPEPCCAFPIPSPHLCSVQVVVEEIICPSSSVLVSSVSNTINRDNHQKTNKSYRKKTARSQKLTQRSEVVITFPVLGRIQDSKDHTEPRLPVGALGNEDLIPSKQGLVPPVGSRTSSGKPMIPTLLDVCQLSQRMTFIGSPYKFLCGMPL